MTLDISRAAAIEGWMSEAELTWLARMAHLSLRILEIGSWCGRSTRALADHSPGTIYAMDVWAGFDGSEGHLLATRERKIFDHELADHLVTRKVVPLRVNSQTWELGLGQPPVNLNDELRRLDFLFVDGCHFYEQVKGDILKYQPRMASFGYISGHDYDDPQHPGVKQAVDEVFGSRVKRVQDTTLWYVPPS